MTFSAPTLDYSELTDYFATLKPNLRTLANGAIETSRFIARGSEEVATLSGQVPVVGADVAAQFDAASVILDDVADEIQGVVDLLDADENDPAGLLQTEIDDLFEEIGCTLCEAEVRWTPEGAESILDAEGIEVLLTIAGEVERRPRPAPASASTPSSTSTSTSPRRPRNIGFVASIGLGVDIHDGFYLFPGIDPRRTTGSAPCSSCTPDLDLHSDIELTIAGASRHRGGRHHQRFGGPRRRRGGRHSGRLKIEMPDRLLISDLVKRGRKLSDVLVPSLDAEITADIPVEIALEVLPGDPFRVILPLEFDWVIEDTLKPDIGEANLCDHRRRARHRRARRLPEQRRQRVRLRVQPARHRRGEGGAG